MHVPAGAIPKDGPSAGITMATALASRITGRPARADTAMTGEITLTGQVLPIGGLKEKALAAQRADIKRLIIPRRNEPDIDDIPAHLRKKMKFVLVDNADEVLDAALERRAQRRAEGALAISGPRGVPSRKRIRGEQWQQRRRPRRPGPGPAAAARPSARTTYVQRCRWMTRSCATTCAPRSSPPARPTGGCRTARVPTKALMEDKKVQKELKEAATRSSEAADTLRGTKKRRKGPASAGCAIGLVGAGLALALARACARRSLTLCSALRRSSSTRPAPLPTPASSSSEPVGTT